MQRKQRRFQRDSCLSLWCVYEPGLTDELGSTFIGPWLGYKNLLQNKNVPEMAHESLVLRSDAYVIFIVGDFSAVF